MTETDVGLSIPVKRKHKYIIILTCIFPCAFLSYLCQLFTVTIVMIINLPC